MLKRPIEYLARTPKLRILAICLISLLLVGYGDFLTGVEVNFTLFYFIPISILAWTVSTRVAILSSAGCVFVWAIVDYFGRPEPRFWPSLWNIGIQFGIFLTLTYALSRIRKETEEQNRLNRELEVALAEVKMLSGLLPMCAWCRRIRDESGNWVQLEWYVVSHSEASFSHGICPSCAEKSRLNT
jgi:hypothetical protein